MSSISYNKTISELHKAIVELNYKNKVDIHNLHKSSSSSSIPNWQDVLWNDMNKRLLTIKNPEGLNTNNNHIKDVWVITYMGRDLSLEEDNYRWDIHNTALDVNGYWIIEREFIKDTEWVYVRWGNLPTNVKERKETIHKSRLKDRDGIERDMINAIRGTIGLKLK